MHLCNYDDFIFFPEETENAFVRWDNTLYWKWCIKKGIQLFCVCVWFIYFFPLNYSPLFPTPPSPRITSLYFRRPPLTEADIPALILFCLLICFKQITPFSFHMLIEENRDPVLQNIEQIQLWSVHNPALIYMYA